MPRGTWACRPCSTSIGRPTMAAPKNCWRVRAISSSAVRAWPSSQATRIRTRGLRRARELSPAWLAVTSSAEGVYWLDGDRVRHEPAFAVETVDTLGAGDIFHAAFALALAEGRDERAALRFANAAAALKCTRPGGGAGAPRRHEVETFLKERM